MSARPPSELDEAIRADMGRRVAAFAHAEFPDEWAQLQSVAIAHARHLRDSQPARAEAFARITKKAEASLHGSTNELLQSAAAILADTTRELPRLRAHREETLALSLGFVTRLAALSTQISEHGDVNALLADIHQAHPTTRKIADSTLIYQALDHELAALHAAVVPSASGVSTVRHTGTAADIVPGTRTLQ